MRTSSTTNPVLSGDALLALELGHNGCAEHEVGIQTLADRLGLPRRIPGDAEQAAQGLALSRVPPRGGEETGRVVYDHGEDGPEGRETVFGYIDGWWGAASVAELLTRHQVDVRPLIRRDKIGRKRPSDGYTPRQTESAWGDAEFLIATRDDTVRAYVRQLHDAWERGDLIVTIQGSMNPFRPVVGLTLGVWGAVPESMKTEVREALLDAAAMHRAAQATGIIERLKAAGRRYYACSPRWITEVSAAERASAHPVMFWLNPMQQNQYHYGWYTVEELDAWCENQGPIVTRARDNQRPAARSA